MPAQEKRLLMKGYSVIWLALVCLCVIPSSAQVRRRQNSGAAFRAKAGFYVQFEMCHACAFPDWQKHTATTLAGTVGAILVSDEGDHYSEQGYATLRSIRLRKIRNNEDC